MSNLKITVNSPGTRSIGGRIITTQRARRDVRTVIRDSRSGNDPYQGQMRPTRVGSTKKSSKAD